jgi:hypothetical protein
VHASLIGKARRHDGGVSKVHCKGMQGPVDEAIKHTIEDGPDQGPLLDAAIIAPYQRMTHTWPLPPSKAVHRHRPGDRRARSSRGVGQRRRPHPVPSAGCGRARARHFRSDNCTGSAHTMNTHLLLGAALVVLPALGATLWVWWTLQRNGSDLHVDAGLDKADFDIGNWPRSRRAAFR